MESYTALTKRKEIFPKGRYFLTKVTTRRVKEMFPLCTRSSRLWSHNKHQVEAMMEQALSQNVNENGMISLGWVRAMTPFNHIKEVVIRIEGRPESHHVPLGDDPTELQIPSFMCRGAKYLTISFCDQDGDAVYREKRAVHMI